MPPWSSFGELVTGEYPTAQQAVDGDDNDQDAGRALEESGHAGLPPLPIRSAETRRRTPHGVPPSGFELLTAAAADFVALLGEAGVAAPVGSAPLAPIGAEHVLALEVPAPPSTTGRPHASHGVGTWARQLELTQSPHSSARRRTATPPSNPHRVRTW
jgi:hypothetical protein